jgi:hypothetical protein
MVKKLAANPSLNFRKMYADAVNNEWAGRLYVTLNDDYYSLQMLPDLSASLEDKIMIFKAAPRDPKFFPPAHILEPKIAGELPHLGRWLLEWDPPEHVVGTARFGVKSFIHEGLRVEAMRSGQYGDLLEIMEIWIKRCKPLEVHGKIWEGTAIDWFVEANQDEILKDTLKKFTIRQITLKFSEAARIEGSRVKALDGRKNTGRQYQIYLNGDSETKKKSFDPSV